MHLVFLIQTTQSVNQSINQLVDKYTALDQQSVTKKPTERNVSVCQDTRFVDAAVESQTKTDEVDWRYFGAFHTVCTGRPEIIHFSKSRWDATREYSERESLLSIGRVCAHLMSTPTNHTRSDSATLTRRPWENWPISEGSMDSFSPSTATITMFGYTDTVLQLLIATVSVVDLCQTPTEKNVRKKLNEIENVKHHHINAYLS